MIYLDYSATTPISYDVLDSYNKASKDYIGNPNSIHALGIKAKELLNSAILQMTNLLNIDKEELTFTSGATEANNMAFKGILKYANDKKSILVSKLEHPSIYKICDYLETKGYHIDYVENDENGKIDFDDLKKKINEDTFLVSICAVNSEMGIRQPLKTIRQIIKKENPNIVFHSDITQALGKVNVNLHDVDLASASAHKIYGPKGIGFLYTSKKVRLEPLIHGSSKDFNYYNPGTPPLPLIVAFSKALRIALTDLDQKENFIKKLNDKIIKKLATYPKIKINQTCYSIPHILNVSLIDIKSETFVHALEEDEIYIGTKTACSKGEMSSTIMALYNDKKRAQTTIRISLSHLTTVDEVNKFLKAFDLKYQKLISLGGD